MSHTPKKNASGAAKPVKTRRRRPSAELLRRYMCNEPECGRRYEEFRTLQQHLQTKHGVRVSLRDKSMDCSVFDTQKARPAAPARGAAPVSAATSTKLAPAPISAVAPAPAPLLPSLSSEGPLLPESESDGEGDADDEGCGPWALSALDDTDADWLDIQELMDTSFVAQAPSLPYTEDEIVSMYMQCLKEESASANANACVGPVHDAAVPDHNHDHDHALV